MFEAKSLHFVGVGGIGMSGLATLALEQGLKVSGSDICPNEETAKLQKQGMKFYARHKRENVTAGMTLVLSTAIDDSNPEVIQGKKLELPIWHRSDILGFFINSIPQSLAVTGTHGKTTTTSILGWVLQATEREPTIISGGIMKNFSSNIVIGRGEFLVAEADESDRSFLKYRPEYAIVTNIDNDHLEKYSDFEDLKSCFLHFINNTRKHAFLNGDDPYIKELLPRINVPYTLFGFSSENHIFARNFKFNADGCRFIVQGLNASEILGHSPLFGRHNLYNILATFAVCQYLKLEDNRISHAISQFSGVERRFQTLLQKPELRFISDYAHHPTEIEGTLKVAGDIYTNDSLRVVIEPHRYSRMHFCGSHICEVIKKQIGNLPIFILPIYGASETEHYGFESDSFFKLCCKRGLNAIYVTTESELEIQIKNVLEKNSNPSSRPLIFLYLGAGQVHQWAKNLAQRYEHLQLQQDDCKSFFQKKIDLE
ncbi:UDP-N-acetylmuramate--L-alanine ligase [Candidatus Riflebacteria bacterium]